MAAFCGCSESVSDCQCAQSDSVLEYPIAWQKSGTYSQLGRSVRLIVRDTTTLAQIPLGDMPVDFSTQMVLVAGQGPTPSGGMGIRIERVWEQDGRLRVQERQIHPGLELKRGLDPASPWTAVVISRSDLNVEGYSPVTPHDLLSQRSAFGAAQEPKKPTGSPLIPR
jgi:hypothetical protein